MWIVTTLVLLAGGLLGASSLVLSKRPDAKPLLDKLAQFQGIIGVILLVWGIFDVINVIRFIGLISGAGFWWFIFLLVTLTELGLGFLLGFGVIMKYALGKNPQAAAKAEQARAKLTPYQGPLGVLAIVLAILFLILSLR